MTDYRFLVDQVVFYKRINDTNFQFFNLAVVLNRKTLIRNGQRNRIYQILFKFTNRIEWVQEQKIHPYQKINRILFENSIQYGRLFGYLSGQWLPCRRKSNGFIHYLNHSHLWSRQMPLENLLLYYNGIVHGIVNLTDLMNLGSLI